MTPEEQLRAAAEDGTPRPETKAERPRRLSLVRIGCVLAVVVAGVFAYVNLGEAAPTPVAVTTSGFAPYVDVTATPLYGFENPPSSHPSDVVLGFVVSSNTVSKARACTPSWGGAYSLDQAAVSLDLDRRVARLQQLGGDVAVSFGGAANAELAVGCSDPTSLAHAYGSVVERYSADTIDLDIEGAASLEPAVNARRAQAIAVLQAARRQAGDQLRVWLTLPVGPDGLTSDGLAVLGAFQRAHVQLAGVNAMVMDYGDSLPTGRSLITQAEMSLTALQGQVRSTYATAGTSLSDVQAWQMVGATPMIGQNDTAETFGLGAARQLVAFARDHSLQRISMWSANRDQDCGPNYPDLTVVSDQCSGVKQPVGAFATILRRFAPRTVDDATVTASSSPSVDSSETAPDVPRTTPSTTPDDPATSPYPIWNAHQGYAAADKVVWNHNVYQAKWYSQGSRPDAPVTDTWQTPWTLLGPVLPGETPVAQPTLQDGTYPRWDPAVAYVAGTRILYKNVGYQAKWWTQGDVPDAVLDSPYDSPWKLLDGG